MTARLFAAAERVDAYFSGRMGPVVPDETRQAILTELSAAVAEAKAIYTPDPLRTCGTHTLHAATVAACLAGRPAHF